MPRAKKVGAVDPTAPVKKPKKRNDYASEGRPAPNPRTEESNPEAFAEELMRAEGDVDRLAEIARLAGVPPNAIATLARRVRARYSMVRAETRKLTSTHFLDRIEEKIDMALDYLDDHVLATANARDLAVILGILLEKRQLLRGEPTMIITTTERVSLDVLASAFYAEASRRGIALEGRVQEDGSYAVTGTSAPDPRTHPRMGGLKLETPE